MVVLVSRTGPVGGPTPPGRRDGMFAHLFVSCTKDGEKSLKKVELRRRFAANMKY